MQPYVHSNIEHVVTTALQKCTADYIGSLSYDVQSETDVSALGSIQTYLTHPTLIPVWTVCVSQLFVLRNQPQL